MNTAEQVLALLRRRFPEAAVHELIKDLYMNLEDGSEPFAEVVETLWKEVK